MKLRNELLTIKKFLSKQNKKNYKKLKFWLFFIISNLLLINFDTLTLFLSFNHNFLFIYSKP